MPTGIYYHKPHTEETKIKMRKPRTEEHKRHISEGHKNKPSGMLGKKQSEETRQKMREVHKRIGSANRLPHPTGEKHWNWNGGITIEYPNEWTDDLKESIRKRDNYICQECGIHQKELNSRQKKLDCHHKDYNKDNLNPENLITLCRNCHIKTNFDRDYWINHFKR